MLSLGKDQITKILGDQLQNIIYRNNQKWALENDSILQKLTKIQMEKYNEKFSIFNYKKGDIVAKKNSILPKLYTVMKGNLIYVFHINFISEIIWIFIIFKGSESFENRKIFLASFLMEQNRKKKYVNKQKIDIINKNFHKINKFLG